MQALIAPVGLLTAATLCVRPATAEEDATFALSWEAGESVPCVTAERLRSAVEAKLGRSPFTTAEHAEIMIRGRERRDGAHVHAYVEQRRRDGVLLGSRDLHAKDCEGLLRAATLVVALTIDPEGEDAGPAGVRPTGGPTTEAPKSPRRFDAGPADGGGASRQEDRPPSEPLPPRPPASSPPATERSQASPSRLPKSGSAKASAPTSKPSFVLSLGVGAGAEIGLLPSTATQGFVVGRLDAPASRVSVDWSGGFSLAQTLERGAVRASFRSLEQRVRACWAVYRVSPRSVAGLDVCAGGFWSAVIPETRGTSLGSEGWASIGGPMAALGVDLAGHAAAARMDVSVGVPTHRYSFSFRNADGDLLRFYTTAATVFFVGLSGRHTIL